MINLLPKEDKILIEKEYLRRFALVVGFLAFVFICIAAISLFPSYFLVLSEKKIYEGQLNIASQALDKGKAAEIESAVQDFNSKLLSFNEKEAELTQPSATIKQIIKAKSAAIKISGIFYQKNEQVSYNISLQGEAVDRDSLVSFVNNLERLKSVKRVQSPASNLLKGENITFALNIELSNVIKTLQSNERQ